MTYFLKFHRKEFEHITEGLSDALSFTQTIGLGTETVSYEKGGSRGVLGEIDFYTRYTFYPL
jgi:3-deoxy-7-phosphoheptulonate synthase